MNGERHGRNHAGMMTVATLVMKMMTVCNSWQHLPFDFANLRTKLSHARAEQTRRADVAHVAEGVVWGLQGVGTREMGSVLPLSS